MEAVFVDGNNFYHPLMERVGKKVDMRRFAETLAPGAEELRYYTARGFGKGGEAHRGFLRALARQGWRVFLGELVRGQEKMTDVALGVDLALLAVLGKYDRAHLVSGDMDLVPAVRVARQWGKEVVVWAFRGTVSPLLEEAASEVRALDDLDWDSLAWTEVKEVEVTK